MSRKTLAEKIIVLGVDGMDPRLSKKYVDQGVMPNLQRIMDQGVHREDLVLLGGNPTITPPMWTTLATGAYPRTHGITCFWKQDPDDLDAIDYNLDSKRCQAEQIWNVFAEDANKKTLVWHWPGSSWPPTSTSPNLHVVDGSQPAAINMGIAMCDGSYIIEAASTHTELTLKSFEESAAGAGCIIDDLEVDDAPTNITAIAFSVKPVTNVMLSLVDGEGSMEDDQTPRIITPIKDASGWANTPADAKEFTYLLLNGQIRRHALVLKNTNGLYDTVALYQSKKDITPIAVLNGARNPAYEILDQYTVNGRTMKTNRIATLLEIAPDGSQVRMLIGSAMDYTRDELFYPRSLYQQVIQSAGYVPPTPSGGAVDPALVSAYHIPFWAYYTNWQAKALNTLIEQNSYEIVFSHLHNIDCVGHNFWMWAKDRKRSNTDEKIYQEFMKEIYEDTDKYFGEFLHLLDEGWTIVITSDHGLLTSYEEEPTLLGDPLGVNAGIMYKLGYTGIVKTPDGKLKKQIDWSTTKAIATRGNYIWINLLGRNKYGIVPPKEKYALEEQIINDLYNYRDQYGNRVVSIVLRNKDAALFGLDGPETGDLVYWTNEGTNRCHGDSLSTTLGYADTSVSPIFIAAGPGFKRGLVTDRVIRQVDVAPTLAYIGGIRLPAQSEGSIVHQIIDGCEF